MTENLLFLSVSLLVFFAYRQGIRDGVSVASKKETAPLITKKIKPTEAEADLFNQYNDMLSYEFEDAVKGE